MSLVIALKGKDGLVMATDTRTTEGYTLEGPKTKDDSIKFVRLKNDWGLMTYGLTDIGYAGITTIKEELFSNMKKNKSVVALLSQFSQIFCRESSSWEKRNPKNPRQEKDVGFILAGYEREEKKFNIYNFQSPDFLPNKVTGGCILAGKWYLAKFFINKLYKKDMPITLVKDIAAFLLNETMRVEKTVGGLVCLAAISKADGFKWVTENEVSEAKARNLKFNKFFQEQLYSSLMETLNNHNQKKHRAANRN